MPHVLLRRFETSDQGTFGFIYVDGFKWATGELPDYDNKSQISCIPAGRYVCDYTYSPSFRRHLYAVKGVPNRSGIRIHPANYMGSREHGYFSQLYGCIALGRTHVFMGGQKSLSLSRAAVSEFEQETDCQPFLLEIRNEYR